MSFRHPPNNNWNYDCIGLFLEFYSIYFWYFGSFVNDLFRGNFALRCRPTQHLSLLLKWETNIISRPVLYFKFVRKTVDLFYVIIQEESLVVNSICVTFFDERNLCVSFDFANERTPLISRKFDLIAAIRQIASFSISKCHQR